MKNDDGYTYYFGNLTVRLSPSQFAAWWDYDELFNFTW